MSHFVFFFWIPFLHSLILAIPCLVSFIRQAKFFLLCFLPSFYYPSSLFALSLFFVSFSFHYWLTLTYFYSSMIFFFVDFIVEFVWQRQHNIFSVLNYWHFSCSVLLGGRAVQMHFIAHSGSEIQLSASDWVSKMEPSVSIINENLIVICTLNL